MATTFIAPRPETLGTLAPETPAVPERWLTLSQAAEHMGVSRRTIYNWMNARKLRMRQTVSGSWRVLEASLWVPEDAERVAPKGQAGRDAANAKRGVRE